MPVPKVNRLDKKIPTSLSVSRRTKIAFEKTCASLGVVPSNIMESLMKDFINEVNTKPKKK